jgi:surface polysaccharide O-acyltransferase-like enzyme
LSAIYLTPVVNWEKAIFLYPLVTILANIKSMSVAVNFLSSDLVSLAILANVFPSISFAPAEKLLNTSSKELALLGPLTTSYFFSTCFSYTYYYYTYFTSFSSCFSSSFYLYYPVYVVLSSWNLLDPSVP